MKISTKKCKKGEYGYLNYQRFFSTIRALLVFLVAIAIFTGGYLYYGYKENVITVLSVLTLLPACHMLVLCIMHWRFSTGSEEIYSRIKSVASEEIPIFFDSVLTVEKGGAYQFDVFICVNRSLIGYTANKTVTLFEIEKHIKSMLKQNQIDGIGVKLFSEVEPFIKRLSELSAKSDSVLDADLATIELIKAVSL